MSFRRKTNAHEWWHNTVQENTDLLRELPKDALVNESAFRDYVTCGVHRDVAFAPTVFNLSRQALEDLWTFITHKAQFDMDVLQFDDFNEAYPRSTR